MLEWNQSKSWMIASRLQKRWLPVATNAVAAMAIIFFGQSLVDYDFMNVARYC